MILLQASHIYKSFGEEKILEDVTLTVQNNERIGLVGANGAGKSTLLKIITGEIEADRGDIFKAKDVAIGYLSQDGGLESGRTVWEELQEAYRPLINQEQELRELESLMGDPCVIADKERYNQVSKRYATLEEQFRLADGYSYKATIRSILQGLKFVDEDHNNVISSLSGGQKTRLALAKLLMLKPDILILDEPTNYLDMETMAWLEKYLQSYQGSILVVSHDRYFLDNLMNTIFELENHQITRYNGNYSRFVQLKNERMEQQMAEYKKRQAEKARLKEFVEKNITRASTAGRAKARRKQLEKMQPLEAPVVNSEKVAISFDIRRKSGREVLTVQDLAVGYRNTTVAQNINFQIERGQRVGLLGPNGTGKTTLLKTIAGRLLPLEGEIWEGFHVTIGYHDQEQEHLSPHKTVLNELWDQYPALDEKDARAVLGRFLFSGDDVFKQVSTLSGGERARLALAKLMCQEANFLILDEPTNHLDIYSREALEAALLEYPGTLLFVSHDRYFINKIATVIFELDSGGITSYPGSYDYYIRKKNSLNESDKNTGDSNGTKNNQVDKKPGKGKLHYLRNKEKEREERRRLRRIDELERLIKETEKNIAALEEELYQPEVYGNHNIFKEKSEMLEHLNKTLEKYLEEWVLLEETQSER